MTCTWEEPLKTGTAVPHSNSFSLCPVAGYTRLLHYKLQNDFFP